MRILPVLFSALLLTAATGCSEEELTKEEMLTDGGWVMTALTTDPPIMHQGTLITDVYAQMYEYDKDNILRFYADGSFATDEGETKEFESDPQFKFGEWELSSEADELTVSRQEDTVVYDVLSLTEDMMRLRYMGRDSVTNVMHSFTADLVKE